MAEEPDRWRWVIVCTAGAGLLLLGCARLGLFSLGAVARDARRVPWSAAPYLVGGAVLLLGAVWLGRRSLPPPLRRLRPPTQVSAASHGDGWTHPNSITAAVTSFAAVAALVFTGQQARSTWEQARATRDAVNASREQLRIAEQGQITDRYSKSVAQIGADSSDVRLGGIYALERIMRDSPGDEPTILEVLSAFLRGHRPPRADSSPITVDAQAALTVLGRRPLPTARQHHLDLSYIDLAGADLTSAHLRDSDLTGANLTEALLADADLTDATLAGVDLTRANLQGAILTRAYLGPSFTKIYWNQARGPRAAILVGANLSGASLAWATMFRADLRGVALGPTDLTKANLVGANLSGVELLSTNVNGASFVQANLTRVRVVDTDLSRADTTGANLTGVDTTLADSSDSEPLEKQRCYGADCMPQPPEPEPSPT
jgi:uncharacterized protein YjbI with pentapeptide repeats